MTEFVLVLCGLISSAICLAVGYGLGQKKKIVDKVSDAVDKYSDIASEKVKEVAKDVSEKI